MNLKLLSLNEFKDLKYISIAKDPKLWSTNDQLINANFNKWEKYTIQNDSLIDVIIFKLVITEGWDIPRACMLFQIRDTNSNQLDEQVLGRIRRNPLLLNFENVNESDKEILTTSYVWGLKEKNTQNKTIPVNLKGNVPDQIYTIKNQIQNEIKILTTRLKDLTSIQNDFDINEYLNSCNTPLATSNIFKLYEDLNKSTNDIQKSCSNYCLKQNNYFESWFKFNNNLSKIKSKSKKLLCDYENSMEITTDNKGNYEQYTLSFDSLYCSNPEFTLKINDWIWNNNDRYNNFTFDSDAERDWIDKMISNFNIKTVTIGNQEVKLLGKNFIVNSNIKYQYYSNGIHDSYPDFIMKDVKNRYFLFEVKSLNVSANQNIDNLEYIDKIQILMDLYCKVSKLLKYYFCLPILKGDDWTIYVYHVGQCSKLSFDELVNLINT